MNSWRYRRSLIFIILGFCMGVIAAALIWRPDSAVSHTAVKMAFGTITVILSSYVFAATWDDKKKEVKL